MTSSNRAGRPRTLVQCVETGQVFPSIAAAAAWAFVDRRRIREALQNGSSAGGYRWAAPRAAEPAEPAPAPAEGEVERLAAWLEQQPGGLGRRAACARVAELLKEQAAELERLRAKPVPEQPYELFTELWEQNRQMHPTAGPDPDFPALTFARLAYAAGWEAQAINWRQLCEDLLSHAQTAQAIAVGEGLWNGDEDGGLFKRARTALGQE